MIAKDSTVAVNFLVLDTDGFPATGQASNISASISINGATATAISDTISEKGSGWYKFNHNFDTAGNAFITFTATNCVIMPWEDEVVEISAGPSASAIAAAVWTYTSAFGRGLTTATLAPERVLTINSHLLTRTDQDSTWAAGLSAMSADVTNAKNAIIAAMPDISGLSTFNANTDTVTIKATQAATMVTATGFATPSDIPSSDITAIKTKVDSLHNTDLTGIATATNISTAQSAIIAAMPDISNLSTFDPANDQVLVSPFSASFIANRVWDGKEAYATPTDVSDAIRTISVSLGLLEVHGDTNWSTANISGLSTFNPLTDRVLIDSTQAAGMATATGFATPANITAAQTAIINAMPDVSVLNAIQAGVLNWAVANNVLTLYNADNTVLGIFALTRDSEGNIVRVQPTE